MIPSPPAGPRAALSAAALLVVVALLSACGADVETPRATTTTSGRADAPTPTTATLSTKPRKGAEPGSATPVGKPAPRGSLAFHVTRRAQLRTRPGGKVVATIRTRTEFRSPTILAVAARRPGWVLVRTALVRHHVGWLPTSAGALFEEPRSIVVDLSAKTLSVFHRGRLTDRYRVAIGTDATPTPTGRFAVTDRLRTADPSGDYGCCILALNGHQTKIAQGWGGGDRIAIHATPHTWTLGKQVSHGCIRASDKALRRLMRKIRLGAPVRIRR
ncbi:MAG TPA: L,D-transpeptidase [Baekduia sp.]|uniref:L,D-transpeptidase n=1 Tax=Baekduia sp. TaxID=2600305 RepID=UPI002D76B028|nr:L,D-transpeptidase [Baekduia sp.]HET6507584.1 L,D-transpeptidase [Baekduia sp.]